MTALQPKRCKGEPLTRGPDLVVDLGGGEVQRIERWHSDYRGVSVCSSVDVVDGVAYYHLSVVVGLRNGYLPRLLRAFGMQGAEERVGDSPGEKARHFWKPVEAGKEAA